MRRESGDVADGARAGAFWSAEGFAHEEGGIGFAVLSGFGFLDKHALHNSVIKRSCKALKRA